MEMQSSCNSNNWPMSFDLNPILKICEINEIEPNLLQRNSLANSNIEVFYQRNEGGNRKNSWN